MFSHSTPIIPWGSFQVECEKIWGSFGVGDHFGSCLGRFWGSFEVGDYLGSGIISGRVQITFDTEQRRCMCIEMKNSTQFFVKNVYIIIFITVLIFCILSYFTERK